MPVRVKKIATSIFRKNSAATNFTNFNATTRSLPKPLNPHGDPDPPPGAGAVEGGALVRAGLDFVE